MSLSEELQRVGKEIAAASFADVAEQMNAAFAQFVGWPYSRASGSVIDIESTRTETFACVVYAAAKNGPDVALDSVPADQAGAVIDVIESLDLGTLRGAYSRIGQAKRLRKSPAPQLNAPHTTVTLGIVYAHRSILPLEDIAVELERLNTSTPDREWPDMLVVAGTGVIQYAVQFPGESLSGGYLPPAEGALTGMIPSFYVLMVMHPTGEYTFNKMAAYLVSHLQIFSPGAMLPNWSLMLNSVPTTALVIAGYQYNLKGELRPVPREFHNDRYLPPPPLRIENRKKDLLSTIQFLPWQDGGVVLMKGKMPMPAIMVFFGKKGIERGGTISRPPDVQISYVVPITAQDFNEMLVQFQRRSNMVVKRSESRFTIQKLADEGTRSPFIARIFVGIMRLRDLVYSDPGVRDRFDQHYEFVSVSLMNARETTKDVIEVWNRHIGRVASGEIARLDGRALRIDENVDKQLRKDVETFLNAAVRTLKQGMQNLGTALQTDIGFLFKKESAFNNGILAFEANDRILADYLRQTRGWSGLLVETRNAIEHTGWTLPRVNYVRDGTGIAVQEPLIAGQPFTTFISLMLDRLCCFVEEFTAHCLQKHMPNGITIRELPVSDRPAEAAERFRVTPTNGGYPAWKLAYHSTPFEQT